MKIVLINLFSVLVFFRVHAGTNFVPPRELILDGPAMASDSLGFTCVAIEDHDRIAPCNPAFVARSHKNQFQGRIYGGGQISYLTEVREITEQKATDESINRLFSKNSSIDMEAGVDLGGRFDNWALSVTPYRFVGYTVLRNPVLPQISLFAAQEQSAKYQFGSYVGDDWSWGLQLRGVNRKFVSQTFTLADVATTPNSELLPVQTQSGFYVEPGVVKEWTEYEWRPTFSAVISQLGVTSRKYYEYPTDPEGILGFSVQPLSEDFDWELGVAARLAPPIKSAAEIWRLGSRLSFGALDLSTSVGASDWSLGFKFTWRTAFVGIQYQNRLIEDLLGQRQNIEVTYFQFGVNI